jgi:hypothetical protein
MRCLQLWGRTGWFSAGPISARPSHLAFLLLLAFLANLCYSAA